MLYPIHHQNQHHHRREIDSFDHRHVSHVVHLHHPYDQNQADWVDNYHFDHEDIDLDNFHDCPKS